MVDGIPSRWRPLVGEINGGRIPDGTPGIRDVDAPCEGFNPGEPGGGRCDTDGHYICEECTEISERELRQRRDQCQDCGAKLEKRGHIDYCAARCDEATVLS